MADRELFSTAAGGEWIGRLEYINACAYSERRAGMVQTLTLGDAPRLLHGDTDGGQQRSSDEGTLPLRRGGTVSLQRGRSHAFGKSHPMDKVSALALACQRGQSDILRELLKARAALCPSQLAAVQVALVAW